MKLESFCRDAGDLYIAAVKIAGFDACEVMKEIHRIQQPPRGRIAIPTVEKALQNIRDKYSTLEDKQNQKDNYNRILRGL